MEETKTIIPDEEAFRAVEQKYPGKPPDERYRLAQGEVMLRLARHPTKVKDLYDEVASGRLEAAIRRHNARMATEEGRNGRATPAHDVPAGPDTNPERGGAA